MAASFLVSVVYQIARPLTGLASPDATAHEVNRENPKRDPARRNTA
jgi:hypothetical protein